MCVCVCVLFFALIRVYCIPLYPVRVRCWHTPLIPLFIPLSYPS